MLGRRVAGNVEAIYLTEDKEEEGASQASTTANLSIVVGRLDDLVSVLACVTDYNDKKFS